MPLSFSLGLGHGHVHSGDARRRWNAARLWHIIGSAPCVCQLEGDGAGVAHGPPPSHDHSRESNKDASLVGPCVNGIIAKIISRKTAEDGHYQMGVATIYDFDDFYRILCFVCE